jgi:hypoxanthine phosphoribosyltransferase
MPRSPSPTSPEASGTPPSSRDIDEVLAEADLLHGDAEVQRALDRMAAQITERLADANPLVLVVMVGGVIPAAELLARLDFPLELDYLHVTRYRGATRGGELHWLVRPLQSLADRVVLVADDILDEGLTLHEILGYCRGAGAREVYSAVLVEKQRARDPRIRTADFTGLPVVDRYVFGYGMDYKGYLRNVRGIYAVRGL